jgi:hypothetical protein
MLRIEEVSTMTRLFTIAVAMVLVFGFSVVSFGDMRPNEGMRHHDMFSYSGHVASYDRGHAVLVVNGREGTKVFDVSRANMPGRIGRREDVVVNYAERHGRMVASSVTPMHQRLSGDERRSYGREY